MVQQELAVLQHLETLVRNIRLRPVRRRFPLFDHLPELRVAPGELVVQRLVEIPTRRARHEGGERLRPRRRIRELLPKPFLIRTRRRDGGEQRRGDPWVFHDSDAIGAC